MSDTTNDTTAQPSSDVNARDSIKNFLKNSAQKIESLEKLEIKTIISDSLQIEGGKVKPVDGAVQGISSEIHLITGDITTNMTRDFNKENSQLLEFHLVKENQGQEIIKRNLDVLTKVGETLVSLFNSDGKVKQQ